MTQKHPDLIPESVETHLRCRKESSNSLSEYLQRLLKCCVSLESETFPSLQIFRSNFILARTETNGNICYHMTPEFNVLGQREPKESVRTEGNTQVWGGCTFAVPPSISLLDSHIPTSLSAEHPAAQTVLDDGTNKRLQHSDPSQLLFLKILKAIHFVISFFPSPKYRISLHRFMPFSIGLNFWFIAIRQRCSLVLAVLMGKTVPMEENNEGQTLLSVTPPLLNLFQPETVPFIPGFNMPLPFKRCQKGGWKWPLGHVFMKVRGSQASAQTENCCASAMQMQNNTLFWCNWKPEAGAADSSHSSWCLFPSITFFPVSTCLTPI